MSVATDTRKFAGSVLSVRNAADDAWIDTPKIKSFGPFGVVASTIDVSTAESGIFGEFLTGLPDDGSCAVTFNHDPDDDFLAEMETMYLSGITREFKLVIPEGTKTIKGFTAYVLSMPISIPYNSVWQSTITLCVQADDDWVAPAP
jgi:hypothetical protein